MLYNLIHLRANIYLTKLDIKDVAADDILNISIEMSLHRLLSCKCYDLETLPKSYIVT